MDAAIRNRLIYLLRSDLNGLPCLRPDELEELKQLCRNFGFRREPNDLWDLENGRNHRGSRVELSR